MNSKVSRADAVLDKDLSEFTIGLDASGRLRLARRFAEWSDQLVYSVSVLQPDMVVTDPPPPKVPRGFFLVNVARWQQEEMRDLAHKCGWSLRDLINSAMINVRVTLRERLRIANLLGVHPRDCWGLCQGGEQN